MTMNNKKVDDNLVDFNSYLSTYLHSWLKVLAIGATFIPFFYILDYIVVPEEILPRFLKYRIIATLIAYIQYFVIRYTKPGIISYFHGYFFSIVVGGIITLMTVDLGGFNSTYYAGLSLLIFGVNLLIPWKSLHSALNSFIIIGMYCIINIIADQEYDASILANNLFFLSSTAGIAFIINSIKYKSIKEEFHLRLQLKQIGDALWGEMEIAKQIQIALLPDKIASKDYEITATMLPAEEVGGDYYDFIEIPNGKTWVSIGDVSGHGVESGLVMMMVQTSILTTISNFPSYPPSRVLKSINYTIKENISRLKKDSFVTLVILSLSDSRIVFSGKHQDIIIYRSKSDTIETVPTNDTWLGLVDDISKHSTDTAIPFAKGDLVLLYTDGVTEAVNEFEEMYGQKRLEQALHKYSSLSIKEIIKNILNEIQAFQINQEDDITLLIIKKI